MIVGNQKQKTNGQLAHEEGPHVQFAQTESSTALIFRLDHNLRYIYVSQWTNPSAPVSPTEFLGKRVTEIQPPLHGEGLAERCLEARDTAKKVTWNFHVNGRSYSTQLIPEIGPTGIADSLLGISEDITDRLSTQLEVERLQRELDLEHKSLAQLLRQVPSAVMIAEAPTGKLLMVNEQVENIWRCKLPDVKSVLKFCDAFKAFHADGSEYLPEERPLIRSITQGETVIGEDFETLRHDGTRTLVRVSSSPIRDSDGTIVAGVSVVFDISAQRKELEFHAGESRILEMIARGAALSEVLVSLVRIVESQTERMLCSILILQDDGLHVRHGAAPNLPEFYVQAIDGTAIGPRVGSCGTAMYRGKPVMVTDIVTDPLWEDFRDLALAAGVRACWSTPIFSSSGGVLGSFACYYGEPRGPSPEEQRLIEVATHLAGIAIERKRAEEAVRESEQRYRNVVEAQTEMICRYLPDGTLTFINDAYCRYFEKSRDELIGMRFYDLLPEESRRSSKAFIESLIAKPRAEYVEHEVIKPGGGLGWQQWIDHVIYDSDGAVVELQGIGRDVTDRRLAEQALRRSEEELRHSHEQIRELAGKLMTAQEEERRRISRELHDDLNQKVAALAILVSRIKHQLIEPSDQVVKQLQNVHERTCEIADDIRRLSRQLHPSALEPAGLTAALKSFVSEFSSLEEIEIRLRAPDTSEVIPQDIALCLYRVAQESLRNIVKYAGAGRADVTVSLSDTEVFLTVADSGSGFNLEAARSTGGLGLISMEERVRLLQGKFSIRSRIGAGTTVQAVIPLKKSNGEIANSWL